MPQNVGIGIIYCVVRNDAGAIERLGVQGLFEDQGRIQTKQQVIDAIEPPMGSPGAHLYTMYQGDQGKYELGPRVHVVKKKYLRTDPNEIEEDNLGNLSSC